MSEAIHSRNESLLKFDHARRQARRDQLSGFLQGRDVRMIPFEAVRSQLRQQNPLYRGLQDIPLDQVVGSVGRAHEFTRKFLPLNDGLRERWIGVHRLAAKRGWPLLKSIRSAMFILQKMVIIVCRLRINWKWQRLKPTYGSFLMILPLSRMQF